MAEQIALGIASILILGIAAQWLAWRLRLPSILVLLIFGFLIGPVFGQLDPDTLFGDTLFPGVSLAVALILFEGGITLKFRDVRETGHIVRNLVTIGALVTWVLSSAGAIYILGLSPSLAVLFGAILVVTGPTVVIPLLRFVHVQGRINAIAKWEGIVNDPIGAVLAVLVFEAILLGVGEPTTAVEVAYSLFQTIMIGIAFSGLGAGFLLVLFRAHLVPDRLQNGVVFIIVFGTFVASNLIQAESGLFTVTLLGIILGNQKEFDVQDILRFAEELVVFVLSSIFIVLAARVELSDMTQIGVPSLIFLALLIIIVRPAAVFASTINSGLTWQEKAFLSWMAPRSIVAAAVTAIFALELSEHGGMPEAEVMVPEMFVIIVGTVTVYGLTAAPVGRWLGVAHPNPQGVLIAGAHHWAIQIALALKEQGLNVMLVDSNAENAQDSRVAGLPTRYDNVLSEELSEDSVMGGFGHFLALTANDAVNALASIHMAEQFGRSNVYQLSPHPMHGDPREGPLQYGRFLFGQGITFEDITAIIEQGGSVKVTKITDEFTYDDFRAHYDNKFIPMFVIRKDGLMTVFTTDSQPVPESEQTLISIIQSEPEPTH